MKPAPTDDLSTRTRVLVIGAGVAGIAAAVALRRTGIADVTVLERAGEVGGVWRDNTYPGAACDIQSYLYSYSFAPNPDWTHMFSRQGEILDYLQTVVHDQRIEASIRRDCTVDEARWDSDRTVWVVSTNQGDMEADHLVVATGSLAEPAIPDLPGLDEFTGPVFHSARWDHDADLTGKRVAVVGTGASAIQFVPAIQPQVEQLTLFQRTPAWVIPRHDREIGEAEKTWLRRVPALHLLRRAAIYAERELTVLAFRRPAVMKVAERKARRHLATQVTDPVLREKLSPSYRMGCKRILISNDYYPALDAPNADVVTRAIVRVTSAGLVDEDGTLHPADVIVLGTGFKTLRLPLTDRVHGPDGATMADVWGESQRAYLGTTVAGFPNAYLMHGPNIGLGHNSVVSMFEAQSRYIVDAVRHSVEHGVTVEPTPQAEAEFVATVDRMTEGSVWTSGGCSSWYLDPTGRNSNVWPGPTTDFHRRTRRFRPEDHHLPTAATTTKASR